MWSAKEIIIELWFLINLSIKSIFCGKIVEKKKTKFVYCLSDLQFLFFSALTPNNESSSKIATMKKCVEKRLCPLNNAAIDVPGPQNVGANMFAASFLSDLC